GRQSNRREQPDRLWVCAICCDNSEKLWGRIDARERAKAGNQSAQHLASTFPSWHHGISYSRQLFDIQHVPPCKVRRQDLEVLWRQYIDGFEINSIHVAAAQA